MLGKKGGKGPKRWLPPLKIALNLWLFDLRQSKMENICNQQPSQGQNLSKQK